jgi:hypothetical protein
MSRASVRLSATEADGGPDVHESRLALDRFGLFQSSDDDVKLGRKSLLVKAPNKS